MADEIFTGVRRLPTETPEPGHTPSRFHGALPFLVLFALAASLLFVQNDYWTVIATRAAIYWIIVSSLNLIMGYAGQLAIGYVALLTIGAYTTSILVEGNVFPPMPLSVAFCAAGLLGGAVGVFIGLPALRLRTFYYAITTLGFSTIVTQIALGWEDVTGGGVGLPGPMMPEIFDSASGLYALCLAIAAISTLLTANVARSRFGRSLIAIRDAEVAAEAFGISKAKVLCLVFLFGGILAGIAGGLFASLQTYITPDAFTFELSVMFFTCILIGGRSSIIGPLLGTIILTILPEIAAPLAAWSGFLYAFLILLIVLVMPGGIASLLDFRNRRPLAKVREIIPDHNVLEDLLGSVKTGENDTIVLRGIELSYGGVRAIDGLDMDIRSGEVHGLIGPNGSGKTTTLNVISGYARPRKGTLTEAGTPLTLGVSVDRARRGLARTFQTPHIVGSSSVLLNVMMGGSTTVNGSFLESIFHFGRHRSDEKSLHAAAMRALAAVGLAHLAEVRADRLQHSELRFLEIARALTLQPRYLLLDEPAAGLSALEIKRLGALIREISRFGTGVLLVEHHADLIFEVCDHVTVLNLGQVLMSGKPDDVRENEEVISAYLGG